MRTMQTIERTNKDVIKLQEELRSAIEDEIRPEMLVSQLCRMADINVSWMQRYLNRQNSKITLDRLIRLSRATRILLDRLEGK